MSDRPTPYNSKELKPRDLSPLAMTENPIAYEQGSLFSEGTQRSSRLYDSGANYQMGAASLQGWKRAIAKYQNSITTMIPASQTSLFDLPDRHCDPHAIDPFNLQFHPAEFYRLPNADGGDACIYFVIRATAHVS